MRNGAPALCYTEGDLHLLIVRGRGAAAARSCDVEDFRRNGKIKNE